MRGLSPPGTPSAGPRASPGWATARFCLGFLVLIVLVSTAVSSGPMALVLHDRLTRLLASVSARVLALLGPASALGPYISFNGFGATIEGACDGVQPAYIFACAVLAFPSRWRDKAWGILIGVPIILVINFVRVATVMICGAYWPRLFERVHLYGWQALVIVLTMAVWFSWAELVARPRDRALS